MTQLKHEERVRVQAAETAAEARTRARLVIVTMPVSDRYAIFPSFYGGIAAIAVLAGLALFAPAVPLRTAFFIGAVIFAAASFLLDWLPLRLACVPRHIKHAHARQMAHHAFAARVLAQTERKPGIAFFVSLGERYVEVVTDRDVDLKVPQSVWDGIVAEFTKAAKQDRVCDGLLAAIESCTKVLEQHYPV
ncbi:MAG: hypothetical protein KGJ78_09635 [Alphaproteobacteria bacterium]|nr:hypothetical protein [Alphaproteobacteria bacterium]